MTPVSVRYFLIFPPSPCAYRYSNLTDRISLPTPRFPEVSHSASPSPSVSHQTPPGAHGPGLGKVASAERSPVEAPVIPHGHASISSAKPTLTARVSLPRDAPAIPTPPIAYPASLPDSPRFLTRPRLALTVDIASNASWCAWAWTRQGRFGRKEPSRGSCYPSWSRFNILLCETEDCHLSAKSAHCRPCQYRYVISLYCFLPLVLTVSLSSTCVTACRSRHRPPPLSRPVTTPNRFVTVRLRRHVPCPSPSIAPSSRHHPPPSLRVVTARNRFVTVHLRRTCPTIAPSSGAAPRSALYLQFSTYFEYSRSRAFIIK